MILSKINHITGTLLLIVLAALLLPLTAAAKSAPVVTNVQAAQRSDSFIVDITYDVNDADGDPMWVSVYFSPDGGATWPIRCEAVSGDVGFDVLSGNGRSIQWDAQQDFPGEIANACSIRIEANDEHPGPYFDYFWHVVAGDTVTFAPGVTDTIGFGRPFYLGWHAVVPSIAGMDPDLLAAIDTVYPFDDGLLGYKWQIMGALGGNCLPSLEDCWHPRKFNEATGDSFSYFGPVNSLRFNNDGSGTSPFRKLLPSGAVDLQINALDIAGFEVANYRRPVSFVVNYDPETIILNGEADWAHPEDPEIYPYYIQLNDPVQMHQPFVAGDRIPDRTYVVFKALGRDDARDAIMDANVQTGISGYMNGVRDNTFGGTFSFSTESSDLGASPTWPAGPDGWVADTLGFLTGPSTEFTINMQAVDEHGRRDGTPASLSFDVGYPPCVQCVEVLPKSWSASAWSPAVECVDDPAVHPCFQDVPEMRVSLNGTGPDELEYVQPIFMLVGKANYQVEITDDAAGQEEANHVIPARLYRMSVLLHGMDDPRDSWYWFGNRWRMMAWRYQVDYDCDPYNQIIDGGGNDDLVVPTWGEPGDGVGLNIDPASGLWRLSIDVAVPEQLFQGTATYLVILQYLFADGDPDIAQAIFDATTKQFGAGTIRAVALDQTQCGFLPVRPAYYHYFRGVRPSLASPPVGQTWRDCNLFVPDIKGSLSLGLGAMSSRGGDPVIKPFRLVVETNTGDYICDTN